MTTLTTEEVLGLIGLAIAFPATLSAIFTMKDARLKKMLFLLLSVDLIGCYLFIRHIRIDSAASGSAQAEQRKRETVSREGMEPETRPVITREEAIRIAREQIEREAALAAAEQRRVAEAALRRGPPGLIVGRWALSQGSSHQRRNIVDREYMPDGRMVQNSGAGARYRFVRPDSIVEEYWARSIGYKIVIASPDSFVLTHANFVDPVILRRVK
jgi:hypothetical protein